MKNIKLFFMAIYNTVGGWFGLVVTAFVLTFLYNFIYPISYTYKKHMYFFEYFDEVINLFEKQIMLLGYILMVGAVIVLLICIAHLLSVLYNTFKEEYNKLKDNSTQIHANQETPITNDLTDMERMEIALRESERVREVERARLATQRAIDDYRFRINYEIPTENTSSGTISEILLKNSSVTKKQKPKLEENKEPSNVSEKRLKRIIE